MAKKKKEVSYKKKIPSNKNLYSGLEQYSYLNNAYKPSTNFNFNTPQIGTPMGGSNPFGLSSLGNTNTVTGEAVKSSSGGLSGADALGAIGAGVSGTVDTISTIVDNSKLKDYSDFTNAQNNERESLENISNTTFSGNSASDFLASYNNTTNAFNSIQKTKDLTEKDLVGTEAEQALGVGKALAKGAAAGAAIGSIFPGPGNIVGAAIGATVAGIGNTIGNIVKNTKANKQLKEFQEQQKELEAQRLAANTQMQNNASVGLNNMQSNNVYNIMARSAAEGGPIFKEFSNGITTINEGGTHEENPHQGIQVGIDPEGIPNLVEEGEVIFNDYVFSDRLKVDENIRTKYKLRNTKELTFADAAKDIQKMSEEMSNDPIVRRTMELRLNQLMQEQEMVRQKKNKTNKFSEGGPVNIYKNGEKIKQWYNSNLKGNWDNVGIGLMQAAPIFGSLAAVINDNSGRNEPDYTNVDKYETAINEAYKPIEARTLSDYIEYNPYDISFGLNKLSASQAASRRALANTTNNPAALRAAILSSDYNYGNQIGEELRRAQEYNDANRERVAAFNRGTNQYNADALFRADQFNAQQAANKATALGQVAQWRDQIYNANRAEKSANLTGLYEGIAGLGETFMNLKDRRYLMDNGIIVGSDGKIIQLPRDEENNNKNDNKGSNAFGGKINKTKRRRLS